MRFSRDHYDTDYRAVGTENFGDDHFLNLKHGDETDEKSNAKAEEQNDASVRIVVDTGDNTDQTVGETKGTLRMSLFSKCNVKKLIKMFYMLIFSAYTVYVGFALYYDAAGAVLVCIIGFVMFVYIIRHVIHIEVLRPVWKFSAFMVKMSMLHPRRMRLIRMVITTCACLGLAAFLVRDIWSDVQKLKPLGGLFLFVFLMWLTSVNRRKVNWTPVIGGILLQFGLGLIILRWSVGYSACKFIGDVVIRFMEYTDEGSKFVFGEKYTNHIVIFKIMPVVIFFSSVVSILYYLRVMQLVIRMIAMVLEFVMTTTAIESFAAAAHIFIGQVESSIVLRPFIVVLTTSELHAVLTGGFATVAGSIMAAYIEFGIPPEHILSASFMSAPAALAVSKLSIPETEISKTNGVDVELEVGKEHNVLEAASVGATTAIKLVAYVIVNVIAFIALLSFVDNVISYFGSRVGYPEINFEMICSYVFAPLALVTGIPWSDCRLVAKVIGKKFFVNELLSYADLGYFMRSGQIQVRTLVVSTYILCSFGSIAAMGIVLGAMSASEPRRRGEIAGLMFRSFVSGNTACFMTACVAGVLYQELPVAQEITNGTVQNDAMMCLDNVTFINNCSQQGAYTL